MNLFLILRIIGAVGLGFVFFSWLLPQVMTWAIATLPRIFLILSAGITLGVLAWRFPAQIRAIFSNKMVQKIIQTVFLTAGYGVFFYLYYFRLLPMVVEITAVEFRWSLLFFTIFLIAVVGTLYYLHSNIWPETGKIRRGFWLISIVGPAMITTFALWPQPYRFFEHQTGDSLFWVCPIDQQVFYSAGWCPLHGKKLKQGVFEDVSRAKEKTFSLPKKAEEIKKKIKDWAASEPALSKNDSSGIFHLTGTPGQGGPGVSRTMDGRELCGEPGQKVRLTQLKKVGKIGIISRHPKVPSWATTKKTIVSGKAIAAGCVELASLWGMELFVRVEIINPP